MIEIHFDYHDGGELSYAEGLAAVDDFTTCCLDFFVTENDAIVLKKNGDHMSVKGIMKNDGLYTDKQILPAHNLQKILKAGGLKWQPKLES